jgi:transcriptional regulator with XRE-family HTH domain
MASSAEPSEFWKRLTEALNGIGWPTTQNGLATKLDMSQGSVRRWYTGEGWPEMDTLRFLAKKTGYTLDWLIDGSGDKQRRPKDAALRELTDTWIGLPTEAQKAILRQAHLESLARKLNGDPAPDDKKITKR